MPNSRPPSSPDSLSKPDELPGRPPTPTEIQYYLQSMRPAEPLGVRKNGASRQAEIWKGLAFLALFVSALALIVSVFTSALLAA